MLIQKGYRKTFLLFRLLVRANKKKLFFISIQRQSTLIHREKSHQDNFWMLTISVEWGANLCFAFGR